MGTSGEIDRLDRSATARGVKIAHERSERAARERAQLVGAHAELVGQEAGFVVAVGHADRAIGDGIEDGRGELGGPLVGQDERDALRPAFVQQDGDAGVLGDNGLALVDVDVAGLLGSRWLTRTLLRRAGNEGHKEAPEEFRALVAENRFRVIDDDHLARIHLRTEVEPRMASREHGAQSRVAHEVVEPPDDLLAGAVVRLGMKARLAVLEKLARMRVQLVEDGQPPDHHLLEGVEGRMRDCLDDRGNDVAEERGLQGREFGIQKTGHDVFDESDRLGDASLGHVKGIEGEGCVRIRFNKK